MKLEKEGDTGNGVARKVVSIGQVKSDLVFLLNIP
jgi:hypothetical protein